MSRLYSKEYFEAKRQVLRRREEVDERFLALMLGRKPDYRSGREWADMRIRMEEKANQYYEEHFPL